MITRQASSRAHRRPGVFICYRRELDAGWAPWLYDRLADRFSPDRIFMDLDSIAAGDDFAEVITQSVASCRVLIAMIGKGWSGATDADGRQRLADPADFVRLEIESAFQHGVRVIPLLVEGATMPPPADLPDSLAPLVSRQALTLTGVHRKYDAEQLIHAVQLAFDETLVEVAPPQERPPAPPVPVMVSVNPQLARGHRAAKVNLRLHNEGGGADRSVEVHATALDSWVNVAPSHDRVQVPAGATAETQLHVRAAAPRWWGRSRTARLRIDTAGTDVVPATLEGRFRQRAVFGWPAVVALLVLVALSAALVPRAVADDVIVPAVAMDEASARADLQASGLLVTVSTTPSETVPKGQVVRLGPAPGTRVKRGSVVTLYLSSGKASPNPTPTPSTSPSPTPSRTGTAGCGTVPSVVGSSEQAAKSAMTHAGLRFDVSYRYSASVDRGYVIRTDPGAGGYACESVDVFVSRGSALGCSLSPHSGSAGSTVRMSCEGFSPGEPVTVSWGGTELASTSAHDDGSIRADLTIPDGFSGANYPGKEYVLQVKGQDSGRHASATFTVSGQPTAVPSADPSPTP
jgi:hypothetical protein